MTIPTSPRSSGTTASRQALASLRAEQSFGMSLKKAVRLGFVRIVWNIDEKKYEVVKMTKWAQRTRVA